jgi:hypothetical protein
MIDTFKKLAENLSDKQKAEYYAILHELEINPKADMELARLLQVLQLYKGYYETIPKDINGVKDDLFKVTHEIKNEFQRTETTIKELARQAEQSSATGNAALNQFTERAEKVVTTVSDKLEERLYTALPLSDFKEAGKILFAAGESIREVDTKLQNSIKTLRWKHYGAIAGIAVAIIIGLWVTTIFHYKTQYEVKLSEARIAMAEKMESDNNALIELSKSNKKIMMITGDKANQLTGKKGLKVFAIENSSDVLNLTGMGGVKFTGVEFK